MDIAKGVAAASVHKTELLLYFTLLQLTIIVLAGRIGGALASRVGQSPAVGEIIVGILLGPSLFGLLAPEIFNYVFRSASSEPLQVISQIGLILLMFQIGLEFNFGHLTERRNRKAVVWISVACMVLPFGLGLGLGIVSAPILSPQADALASSLFIGTALSITALPILGRIMIEFRMTQTRLGVIAISAAAINDVIGWLLLAMVSALAVSNFAPVGFAVKVGLVLGFLLLWQFAVRPVMKRVIRHFEQRQDRQDREANDGAVTGGTSRDTTDLHPHLLGIVLAAVFISGMITYKLEIFAIFGGFMMGVILHDEARFVRAWKERIGPFVMVFFLPIFFTYTGLRTNIGGLDTMALWGWCALTVLLATVGKYGGAYGAARLVGMSHHEGNILGVMMNTRALMELIIINVGYDLGVISQSMFTILVIMAIFSTVITTPLLRRWLPLVGHAVPGRRNHVLRVDAVRAKLAELELTEADRADAMAWAAGPAPGERAAKTVDGANRISR